MNEESLKDTIKEEILKLAEGWSKALISNDADAIGSFMAEEWVIVGTNGITTKNDFLPWVRSGDLTHQAMDLISEPRIEVYGDCVVFTGRVTNNGRFRGEGFRADEWTTDVFVKRDDVWRCVLSHITPADPTPRK